MSDSLACARALIAAGAASRVPVGAAAGPRCFEYMRARATSPSVRANTARKRWRRAYDHVRAESRADRRETALALLEKQRKE